MVLNIRQGHPILHIVHNALAVPEQNQLDLAVFVRFKGKLTAINNLSVTSDNRLVDALAVINGAPEFQHGLESVVEVCPAVSAEPTFCDHSAILSLSVKARFRGGSMLVYHKSRN